MFFEKDLIFSSHAVATGRLSLGPNAEKIGPWIALRLN